MIRSIVSILKLFALFIPYLIVKNVEVKQKADLRRQIWTTEILWFYYCTLFVAICLFLAFRVTKNEKLAAVLMICLGCVVIYFAVYSVYFLIWGINLYHDMPKSETGKLPESILIYATYIICFFANIVCVTICLYVLCYVALMTYQMRGVLFAEDDGI